MHIWLQICLMLTSDMTSLSHGEDNVVMEKGQVGQCRVLAVPCVILGPGSGIPSVLSPRSLRVSSRSLPELPQNLSVKGLGREYLFLISPFRFLKHLNRL